MSVNTATSHIYLCYLDEPATAVLLDVQIEPFRLNLQSLGSQFLLIRPLTPQHVHDRLLTSLTTPPLPARELLITLLSVTLNLLKNDLDL